MYGFVTFFKCFRKVVHPHRGHTKCCRMIRLAGEKREKNGIDKLFNPEIKSEIYE